MTYRCVYFGANILKALKNKTAHGHRGDIDGLRAIAVLSVIFFHAGDLANATGGYIGVDVLFVISGFVITSLIKKEIEADRLSIVRFYERRIRRIFPALFILLVIVRLVGSIVLLPDDFNKLGATAFYTTIFVSNWELMHNQDYFSLDADYDPGLPQLRR